MNKILILRSNPVNPDSRVEKESLSLSENGFDVDIFCWDRSQNYRVRKETISVANEQIGIFRVGIKGFFGKGFKNLLPFLKFQFCLKKWIKHNIKMYDAVHACDFDTAFFTYRFVLKKNVIFVFDIFDFLCGKPKNLFEKFIKRSQIKIINSASATIICTESRKKQICQSVPKKIAVIHNSPSVKQFTLNSSIIKSHSNKIKICYVGILQNGGRMLDEIGSFFCKHNNFEFHIGGFGYLDDMFSSMAQKNDNIFFYGKLSYENTLTLENECDIILAIYDPSIENHVFAAPNKFYEGLFLGKPLIMVKNTGMSNIVEDYNIGITIDYDIASFENGLNELIKIRNKWNEMSNKMKKLYFAEFNWDIMSKRLVDLYLSLLK